MEPICELRGAALSYNGAAVLSQVDLRVERGEMLYLVGATGSGKSTLLKALYAEVPLEAGQGSCCGYNLAALRRRDIPYLRRRLGIVFQDFQLLTDRTVADNLSFVLRATGWKGKAMIADKIAYVLARVGLSDKAKRMPHELSGGEQQRVVIARALLNSPDLILADEPTGNLDEAMSEEIMSLLLSIKEAGTAVLMATHDMGTLKKFPARTLACGGGRVEETELQAFDFQALAGLV